MPQSNPFVTSQTLPRYAGRFDGGPRHFWRSSNGTFCDRLKRKNKINHRIRARTQLPNRIPDKSPIYSHCYKINYARIFPPQDRRLHKIEFFASEFYVFRLAGLDSIIDIKDREWTNKRIFFVSIFTTLIVIGGLASIGVGAVLTFSEILLSFELPLSLIHI